MVSDFLSSTSITVSVDNCWCQLTPHKLKVEHNSLNVFYITVFEGLFRVMEFCILHHLFPTLHPHFCICFVPKVFINIIRLKNHEFGNNLLGINCSHKVTYRLQVQTSSGVVTPASFDMNSRCPDEVVRRIRVSVCSYDPTWLGRLLETYDTQCDVFRIAPACWYLKFSNPLHYLLKKSLKSLFTCFKLFVFKTKCLLNFNQLFNSFFEPELFSSYISRCFFPS